MPTRANPITDAHLAYAANGRGDGIAYVAGDEGAPRRISFRVERYPALLEREIGYAALIAAAESLRKAGHRRVRIAIGDRRIVDDLAARRDLPLPLSLLYVRLRCALNRFARAEVVYRPFDEDLLARSRAEVALSTAA